MKVPARADCAAARRNDFVAAILSPAGLRRSAAIFDRGPQSLLRNGAGSGGRDRLAGKALIAFNIPLRLTE
jgi:hypothetical protein